MREKIDKIGCLQIASFTGECPAGWADIPDENAAKQSVCKSYEKSDIDRMKRSIASDVPEYISGFPPKQRKLLKQLRGIIRKTAPKAEEVISYGIPGYKYLGTLVYFAGFENHVGFYPGKGPLVTFSKNLAKYQTGKGSIQFPLHRVLPETLIQRIVRFRIKQNEAKSLARR